MQAPRPSAAVAWGRGQPACAARKDTMGRLMNTIWRCQRATTVSDRGPVQLTLLMALAVWAMTFAPAAATTDATGVHVDEAIADTVDVAALTDAVEQARGEGLDLQVVVRADEPEGGAQTEADRRVVASGGAVLVITPQEVGAVSDGHSDTEVDGALDDALDALEDEGEAAAATAFAEGLHSSGLTTSELPFELPGTGVIVLVVIAVVALSVLPRLFGFGGRRRHHRAGYGHGPRYGSRRRRRGGLGAAAVGAAVGGSRNRSRSGGSRSRGGGSRSRGGGRSRGGSSRRR